MTEHYIRFVGWLCEDGAFELDRGWETPKVTEPPLENPDYRLELLDRNGRVLLSIVPEVDTLGCDSSGGRMKTERVLGYLPWHARGESIRFRKGDRVIDQRRLAESSPTIADLLARVEGERLELSWEAAHEMPLMYDVAIAQGRRRAVRIIDRLRDSRATIPIEQIPFSGECYAVVLATDGLRSQTAKSDTFLLPEKLPRVVILQPRDEEVVSEDDGLSLVANALAPDGRTLDPDALRWSIDAEIVAHGTRAAWIAPLGVGSHRISVEYGDVCASVTVTVRERNEVERRWREDLAELQRQVFLR